MIISRDDHGLLVMLALMMTKAGKPYTQGGTMRISKTHTLDGYMVEPGLRVWDYDLRPRIVGQIDHVTPGGHHDPIYDHDPWYKMIIPDGEFKGQEGSIMNPSRMWFYHPYDHVKA